MRIVNVGAPPLFAVALVSVAGCSGNAPLAPWNIEPQSQMTAARTLLAHFVPSIALPELARVLHSRPAPQTLPRRQSNTTNKWLYTAQFYGPDLSVYQRSGVALTFFETITAGVASPAGTVSTPGNSWYVANGGDSDVLVYRTTNRGPAGPVDTLQDAGQIPGNVDVTPNRNLVAVSNTTSVSGGSGSVSVYLDRLAIPARTLSYGEDLLLGIGVAIDHHGDCFWSFNDETKGGGAIVEFLGCNGTGKALVSGLGFAGGIAFDERDDLYFSDQTVGIYKCNKLSSCKLFATGFGDPVNINFESRHKYLWVADATGYIDAVDPRTGRIVYSVPAVGGSSDPPFGVAPAPGAD